MAEVPRISGLGGYSVYMCPKSPGNWFIWLSLGEREGERSEAAGRGIAGARSKQVSRDDVLTLMRRGVGCAEAAQVESLVRKLFSGNNAGILAGREMRGLFARVWGSEINWNRTGWGIYRDLIMGVSHLISLLRIMRWEYNRICVAASLKVNFQWLVYREWGSLLVSMLHFCDLYRWCWRCQVVDSKTILRFVPSYTKSWKKHSVAWYS